MSVEFIYLTRHGFRSNWLVDPTTGDYTATVKSPTGLPTDPPLTAHGVEQAGELAARLVTLQPPIDQVYSSPYYRCLQTVEPFIKLRGEAQAGTGSDTSRSSSPRPAFSVRCETGLSDWYGAAPFEHPTSAPREQLKSLFPFLDESYIPLLAPTRKGESIARLHDRIAVCLRGIIEQCDKDGVRAVLLCAHAATIIAAGRVLTGLMPDDVETEDFGAFTCGLSVFRRRKESSATPRRHGSGSSASGATKAVIHSLGEAARDSTQADAAPGESPKWADGRGVGGGFDCLTNCDCSHLSGGEERGWRFSGDESFGQGDPLDLGVVVEGKRPGRGLQSSSGNPRL